MLNQTHILNGDMLKYKGDIMSIKSWIADKLGGSVTEIIGSVKDTVDEFHLSGEEKQQFELKMREVDLDFKKLAMDMEESYMKDRQSARGMYQKDSSIQKILTIIFTVGYFGITTFMFTLVMKMFDMDLNDFVVSFISTIFGAFNAIMIQVISFYFGSSKSGEDTGAAIAESFSSINRADK